MNLGITCFLQKKYQAAAETLQQGLKVKPEMVSAWLFVGISESDLSEPTQGVVPLQRYTAMKPGHAEGRYYLGYSFLSLHHGKEAAQALLEARRIDPKRILRLSIS